MDIRIYSFKANSQGGNKCIYIIAGKLSRGPLDQERALLELPIYL